MIVGQVVGNVWATRKEASLTGVTLLLVQYTDGSNKTIVAADQIGAGIGDRVIVASGSSARRILNNPDNPVDAAVVGIIDETEIV